ncbi:MAG: MATE family efflux transporter [Oscillospiraceae bacterium]|nr:MATE family efflux transporter [Oscillospiraceae bacterium]
MTEGKPMGHLVRYAVPLILGNYLQLGYNAVDSIIAGRFIGEKALAAEGVAGPVMNLIILAITGLTIGSGVLMSEAWGAGDGKRLRKTLGTTLTLGLVLSVSVALLGILLARPILRLLAVPEEIFEMTVVYLRITFLGAPFTFAYNALASGLKSIGDSRTPLIFLAISSALNGVLDLIFLGALHMGVTVSAITTVAAEAVSALLSAVYMTRRRKELTPGMEELRPDRAILRRVLAYGAPTALQQTVLPLGKLAVSGQINALHSVEAIAAFNAVTRLDDFAIVPCQTLGSAISTFIAQNRGAGKEERIRPGFRAGIALEVGYYVFIGTVAALFRRPLVAMFVDGEGAGAVIEIGTAYLGYMTIFYLYPAFTNGIQNFFRGIGHMMTTAFCTFLQIGLRALACIWLVPALGVPGVAVASAVGWTAMLIYEVPLYFYTVRKMGIPK